MFTGLIEAVGEVAEIGPTPAGFRLRVSTELAKELTAGQSIALNGVCLTVISVAADELHADVSPETARLTTLSALKRGRMINVERPLRADGRIGGHFVQGHVDSTGTIDEIRQDEECHWLKVNFPDTLAPYIVRKGSIAVDGISLTVAGVSHQQFDVQIVPYTWENTNLKTARPHESVNIECDIIGKYVARVAGLAGLGSTAPSPDVLS